MLIVCWPENSPNNFARMSKPKREIGSHPQRCSPKAARMPLNPTIGENGPLGIHTFQSLIFLPA